MKVVALTTNRPSRIRNRETVLQLPMAQSVAPSARS
jgi:hypothetical protein